MTLETLEKKLKAFEEPVSHPLLKWLYLHLPPQPITNRKMHKDYADSVGILMEEIEMERLNGADRTAVYQYLKAVTPLVEAYEKKEFPAGPVSAEDMLRFLMDQNNLTQSDLAKDLGGQPAVSYVLNGRRKLTREQIARLAARFHVSEASFYSSNP